MNSAEDETTTEPEQSARLEAIRARVEAATAGPWGVCPHMAGEVPDCPCGYVGDVTGGGTHIAFMGVTHRGEDDGCGCTMVDFVEDEPTRQSNARFIATARQDVPYLLDLVSRYQGLLAAAKSADEALVRALARLGGTSAELEAIGQEASPATKTTVEEGITAHHALRAALTAIEGAPATDITMSEGAGNG